jgi:hypothetical protein
MGDDGTVAARKNHREHLPVPPDRPVSDGEDATPQRMQPARRNPSRDHPVRQAKLSQLPPGNNSVL